MAKPKTKTKKKPAGKKGSEKKGKSPATFQGIAVTSTIPSPDPFSANPGQLVPFQNNDNTDYYVQLYNGGTRPVVDVILPKLSTGVLRLMIDPSAGQGSCAYYLFPTAEMKAGVTGGGPHTIVITSGTDAKLPKSKAAGAGH
jgi:hypothetical protein